MTGIIAMLLVSALFAGPLGWRIRRDRDEARSDVIRAEIRAAINQRLGGESVLSVLVHPRSFWRAGRIVLSAPAGYEWLVETVWRDVIEHAPAGYEVVMPTSAFASARSSSAMAGESLARAA